MFPPTYRPIPLLDYQRTLRPSRSFDTHHVLCATGRRYCLIGSARLKTRFRSLPVMFTSTSRLPVLAQVGVIVS
ncbi:unnamed protein product [Peniophora sp. CBMAI 1063]|nr:unnamed protein product [Peniophora sp. CBMAI 1063]